MLKFMETVDGLPVAFSYAVFNAYWGTMHQFVMSCPFCSKSHIHGLGEDDSFVRHSGCVDNSQRYRLVCLGEMTDVVKQAFEKRFGK